MKSKHIQLRVTEQEKKMIEELAFAAGLPVSTYLLLLVWSDYNNYIIQKYKEIQNIL